MSIRVHVGPPCAPFLICWSTYGLKAQFVYACLGVAQRDVLNIEQTLSEMNIEYTSHFFSSYY